jgi:uncharacterized protein YecE (DUF72 family)
MHKPEQSSFDFAMEQKLPKPITRPGLIRFGTSSFSSPDWVGSFYPRGTASTDFLHWYGKCFDTVEIDSTYYGVPAFKTVENWARKTPAGFTLTAKFPRMIVHAGQGPTPNAEALLTADACYTERDLFLEAMSRMGAKLGPLLLQFPYFAPAAFATLDPFLERLERFLTDLPEDYRYAVEVRNREWLTAPLVSLCKARNVALVLVDLHNMPHPSTLAEPLHLVTTDFCYVRLIGNRKEIEAQTKTWSKQVIDRGSRLEMWAKLLLQIEQLGVRSFVYANNHYAGHAPQTARQLTDLLGGSQ